MTTVKILIVEDNLLIAEEVQNSLIQSGYEIASIITRGEDVQAAVRAQQPDLVLMDIKLEGAMDGIEAAETIRNELVPVIFLTDMDDEVTSKRVRATHPAAYLIKPFNNRQLQASIQLALHNASFRKTAEPGQKTDPEESAILLKEAVFIKTRQGFDKVKIKDILWMHADGTYTELVVAGGKKHLQTIPLGSLHERINSPDLIRVHRSWIVNINHIERTKTASLMIGETEVPVSFQNREELQKRLQMLK